MVPGIGYAFKCFIGTLGVIEELKSPCNCRGLVGMMKYCCYESDETSK